MTAPLYGWKLIMKLGVWLLLAVSLNACAGPFGIGGESWKEEVLLHDGQKIIAERYVKRGGRHEVGQQGAYIEQTLSFTMPGGGPTIEWKDDYSEDLGSVSFLPMLLDIADGTPYLVAKPMGCQSYNKWGRPNPPYVVFKHEANTWRRIALAELPTEIKTPNLISSSPDIEAKKLGQRLISAEAIQKFVGEYARPEFKSILREPVNYDPDCIPMVTNGKGLWLSQGWFSSKPNFEACLVGCKREKFDEKTCPCNKIFEGK